MIRDALVVGINTYSYERLNNLTAPAQDAEAVAQLLEKYGDFKVTRLPAVKDKQNDTICVGQKSKVTLTQLQKAIVQLFKPEGKPPDTALLYFSGHGLRQELGITEGFLASSDVNPDMGNWGVRLQWLRRLLQESEVRQQIIILDCCYAGEVLNVMEADPGDRGEGRDRCFIAASRSFEVAYEEIGSSHSVLTAALIKGLEPKQERWVTNYTLVDLLNQEYQTFPQRPIFTNSGEPINLTRRWTSAKKDSVAIGQAICPYKGLNYFDCTEEDARYFCGRTALTDELLEKVRQGNFLVVLGASGSGKSSVVRAGLLYQLRLGRRLSGSESWQIKIFQPGEHPLDSLALAFLDPESSNIIERATQLAEAEELIKKSSEGLRQLIAAADTQRVILVIDQFEEVFTLCKDTGERQQFFESLLVALQQCDNKLCLVLTMRADFLGKCAEQEYSGLAQQIQENLVIVTPMKPDDLRKAIVEPAKQVQLEIEPELVEEMLTDVVDAPGYLPLLQYTLTQLWEQRTDNCLRLNTYAQLGGVMGTLRKRATEVYETFTEEEQASVRHIFLALTQLGEGTEDTRRRVLKQDLVNQCFSEELIDKVVQQLANKQLVVTSEMVIKGEAFEQVAVVDVAHEALIRHWTLLRKWINENRDNLRQKRKFESLAEDWRTSGKSKDYLLQGKFLKDAFDWQKQNIANQMLSNLAEEFIKTSIKQRRQNRFKFIGFSLIMPVSLAAFLGIFSVNLLTTRELRQTLEKSQGSARVQALQELVKRGASLNGITLLRRNDLSSADLSNAKLSGADLSSSILINTKLRHANLNGAILSGADFSDADLRGADLRGAILSNVKLYESILGEANLKGVKISNDDINNAFLCNTIMPDGNVSNRNCAKIDTNSTSGNTDIGLPKAGTIPQYPDEVKVKANQPVSLKQAIELAQRNNKGSFAESRLQATLEYYDLQEAYELIRIARSGVTNAQSSLRDMETLDRTGLSIIQDAEIFKLSRAKTCSEYNKNKEKFEAFGDISSIVRCTDKEADIIQQLAQTGAMGRNNVLRSQVNLANLQQELTTALSQEILSRRRLANRLGFPQSVIVSAADPFRLAGLWNFTLEQSIILALQNRSKEKEPNQISLEVQTAYSATQSNLENVQTANTALNQARELLRLDRLRFQALFGSQADVIQSESLLTIAEKNRVRAIIDYNRALARLIRVVSSDNGNLSNSSSGVNTPPKN